MAMKPSLSTKHLFTLTTNIFEGYMENFKSKDTSSSIGNVVIKTSNITSNVSASATSVTILATNEDRVGVTIYNDSSADLYINWGLTASTTNFSYFIAAGSTWECPANMVDSSQISGIWSSATGTARITEAVEV